MTLVHGTCVEMSGTGVLLRGASGGGKSDLALRLIDGGARLVADDQVSLSAVDGDLIATAPETLSGRIEVRGVGIVAVPTAANATIGLVIDLSEPDRVPRLPDPARCELLGLTLPLIALAPFESSAAAKVRLVVGALSRGKMAGS